MAEVVFRLRRFFFNRMVLRGSGNVSDDDKQEAHRRVYGERVSRSSAGRVNRAAEVARREYAAFRTLDGDFYEFFIRFRKLKKEVGGLRRRVRELEAERAVDDFEPGESVRWVCTRREQARRLFEKIDRPELAVSYTDISAALGLSRHQARYMVREIRDELEAVEEPCRYGVQMRFFRPRWENGRGDSSAADGDTHKDAPTGGSTIDEK